MKRAMWLCATALAVLPACGEDNFEVPPDCSGRRLVVYARQSAPDTADVYLYDLEVFGFHLLPGLNSSSQAELDPAITPDGRFIAFERLLGGDVDVLFYDRCQATIVPQPGLNTVVPETDPAFSNNGVLLAFARDTLSGREIRLYDGVATRLVPLPGLRAPGTYLDHSPALDADGGRLAFVSTRNGNQDILVYDADGDSLMALPDLVSASSEVEPSLSSDGRYLAFASDRPGGEGAFDIYLYDLQTRQFVTLHPDVNTDQTERSPSLDPTAERIVFETSRNGTLGARDLWIHTRASNDTRSSGASSPGTDIQPYVVWR